MEESGSRVKYDRTLLYLTTKKGQLQKYWVLFIPFLFLLMLIVSSSVNPAGGTITRHGDSITYDNVLANMTVTPEISMTSAFNPKKTHIFEVTSKGASGDLCISYKFNYALEYGKLEHLEDINYQNWYLDCIFENTTLENGTILQDWDCTKINDYNWTKTEFIDRTNKITKNQYEGSYYYTGKVNFKPNEKHTWRINYIPNKSDNTKKWDLKLWNKNPSKTCQQTFLDGSYNFFYDLDPSWGNTNFIKSINITVEANASNLVEANYTANLTLNTEALISEGKMQSDCDDLIVACQTLDYSNYIERDRNVSGCNTATTLIEFAFPVNVSAGTKNDTACRIYYENSTFDNPMNYIWESAIWLWNDDMTTNLGWENLGLDIWIINETGTFMDDMDINENILVRDLTATDNRYVEFELNPASDFSGIGCLGMDAIWNGTRPTVNNLDEARWLFNNARSITGFSNGSGGACGTDDGLINSTISVGVWNKIGYTLYDFNFTFYKGTGGSFNPIVQADYNTCQAKKSMNNPEKFAFTTENCGMTVRNFMAKREYENNPVISNSSEMTLEIVPLLGVELTSLAPNKSMPININTTYDVTLKNTGGQIDNFTLYLVNDSSINTFELSQTFIQDLAADGSVNLTVTIGNSLSGNFSVDVFANSTTNLSVFDVITLLANITNQPPVITGIQDVNISEDTAPPNHWINLSVYTTDNDSTSDQLTFFIESQSNDSLISCSIVDQEFFNCSQPSLNQFGNNSIVVNVTDGELWGSSNQFNVTVVSINDAPTIVSGNAINETANFNETIMISGASVITNESFSPTFSVKVEDPDDTEFTFRWFLDGIFQLTSQVFNWVTGFTTGRLQPYDVTVFVNDSENATTSFNFNVTVENVNRPNFSVEFLPPTPLNNTTIYFDFITINVSIEIPDGEDLLFNFNDSNQNEFGNGDFYQTLNDTNGVKIDIPTYTTGTYESEVFNATEENVNWVNISWVQGGPYQQELPNNQEVETKWQSGNADMTGNVLLMHMNDVSGPIADNSGNNNHGAYNGEEYGATGKFNTALDFDGVDDYVDAGNDNSLNTVSTMSAFAWVKYDNLSDQNIIISKWDATIAKDMYELFDDNTSDEVRLITKTTCGGDNTVDIKTATILQTGVWYFIGFTYDGTTTRLYLNGIEENSSTGASGNLCTQDENVNIGRRATGDLHLNGTIDEVAIWNRALLSNEILENYKRGLLKLNMTVRSCDDAVCSGENFVDINDDSPQQLSLANNTYFQYKAFFETENNSFTPILHNVSIFAEFTAEAPTVDIDTVLVELNGSNSTMTKSGDYWDLTFPDLEKGEYTFIVNANDSFNNFNTTERRDVSIDKWDIIFDVRSGEDGSEINLLKSITCNYSGFNKGSDNSNPYGPYGFPQGNWQCTFGKEPIFWNETVTFIADDDKTVNVTMSLSGGLSFEEHSQLDWLYNCWNNGDCWNLLHNVNQTTTKIWDNTKRTDPSVILNEITLSNVLSSTSNISLNYTVHIPRKAGYQDGDLLPLRMFFWFINPTDNQTCFNQNYILGETAEDPFCNPLMAQTLGPMSGNLTFTVDLRPNLSAGTYEVIRAIEIDPLGTWINYGQEVIGSVNILESNSLPIMEISNIVEIFGGGEDDVTNQQAEENSGSGGSAEDNEDKIKDKIEDAVEKTVDKLKDVGSKVKDSGLSKLTGAAVTTITNPNFVLGGLVMLTLISVFLNIFFFLRKINK